jgi:hypothetical protein
MRPWIIISLAALLIATPAWASVGRVKSASGGTYVERGGKRLDVQPGFVIEPGDVMVTPAKGRVGMTFVDNCRMAAGPNSRVVIRTFDYNDTTQRGRFVTEVSRGAVAIVSGLIAKSGPDAMRVKTPTALLAVRGARMVVRVK